MNKRIMEDIRLENGKVHKIIQSDHSFVVDTDSDTFEEEQSFDKEKEVEDKINKYINYRYSPKSIARTPSFKKKKKSSSLIFIIFILTLLSAGVYFSSIIFEKTEVSVTAKQQSSNLLGKQFTASKDQETPLGFEIMIMSGEEKKSMVLTETQDVSLKAKGQVTFYNESTKTAQNLLVGTFISDNDGKTYRLDNTVSIPGYKTDKDNKIIPGSVDVSITAFLPGDSYNGKPTDFHIVSFKGTAKYTKIYGKAKTSLSGGASGIVYALSDKEKEGITSMADSLIKGDLLNKLNAEIPDGYIYYPGAISYSYSLADNNFFQDPKAEIHITYNLSVVLLKKDDLTKTVIRSILPKATDKELNEITISDLSNLTFAFINKDQSVSKEMQSVLFTLDGSVNLVWNPNSEDIKNKLIGISKDNVYSVFNAEESIKQATLKMFPPWQKNLPTDPSRIKIKIQ